MNTWRESQRTTTPLFAGFLWALAAAVSFGVTTPLVARLSGGIGAWTAAALLYAGAAVFALPFARGVVRALRTQASRRILIAEAIAGAMLAPAALAYGLKSASALSASLALNAEVPFSIALAALVFRESISRRVYVACVAILVGASLLMWNGAGAVYGATGLAFVLTATFLWAVDNALSSLLVDVPFATTVFCKATFGASFALLAALIARERAPALNDALGLACVGAIGYGGSLWAYLRAQRIFGIARTASVFALAPFAGAALAFALGDRGLSSVAILAVVCLAAGAYLHVSERHAHSHVHEEREHDHVHVHDDEHHDHTHERDGVDARGREHAHSHRHAVLVHDHPHAPDVDHRHAHEQP